MKKTIKIIFSITAAIAAAGGAVLAVLKIKNRKAQEEAKVPETETENPVEAEEDELTETEEVSKEESETVTAE